MEAKNLLNQLQVENLLNQLQVKNLPNQLQVEAEHLPNRLREMATT
jgi:hypothetical protein